MIQLGDVQYLSFVKLELLNKNKTQSEYTIDTNESSDNKPNNSEKNGKEYNEEIDQRRNNKEIVENKQNRIILDNKNLSNQTYQNL